MSRKKVKLGQMLIEAGIIDEFQLNSALSHQRNCGEGRLGTSLVKLRYISEENLHDFLSRQLGIPRIDPSRRRIPSDILSCISAETAWKYKALPIDRKEMNGTPYLLVVMADPINAAFIDALQLLTGCRIRPALAYEATIVEALVSHYGPLVTEEDDLLLEALNEFSPEASPSPASAGREGGEFSLEEKYRLLLKILLDKGILSLREFDRVK